MDLERNSIDGWSHCIYGEGQTFSDAEEFRIQVTNYVVATRRSFLYETNDSEKIIVICTNENFKWRIYASRHKANTLFDIQKCNLQHTRGKDNLRTRGHPKANSN